MSISNLVKILYEDERRLLRKNTNKDSLNSESSSDSEEREGPSSHQGKLLIEKNMIFY